MAKNVIMPALGMIQETGTLLKWLKSPGDSVSQGEPLMEVETDKATVEVEAPASGILSNISAQPGDVIPVGQTIARIVAPDEASSTDRSSGPIAATPLARRVAAEHNVDLSLIKPKGDRIQKGDVLAFIDTKAQANGRPLASPKARRLAQERGLDLKTISGSGPGGAVLAADVLMRPTPTSMTGLPIEAAATETPGVSRMWRAMVERISQAWTTVPHFYLMREVNATRLIAWRENVRKRTTEKITYTDLLVKLAAAALRQHPRLNASWQKGTIVPYADINVGIAVAVEDGLLVPVIHHADHLGLGQLAARRAELVTNAQANKLPPDDLSGGTFTISNLGMYGVDAFNAIINPPQAALLAVGRIADRVVPLNGQPAVQPMMTFSLSCDHRVVDGARGAQFLQTLAELIEDPLRLLD